VHSLRDEFAMNAAQYLQDKSTTAYGVTRGW